MFGSRMYAAVPPRLPGMTGSALGFGAAIAATVLDKVLDAAFGLGSRPLLALALLAAVALGVGSVTTMAGALACAAQCWGMYSGFVLHGFGQLQLDPSSRVALPLLVGLAVGGSLLGMAVSAALGRYRTRAMTSVFRAEAADDRPRRPIPVGGRAFHD